MACRIINLRSQMPGSDAGGAWSYLGYNISFPGAPGGGGSSVGTLTGDNPAVDFQGFTPGYYHFRYTVGGECEEQEDLIIHVQDRGSAGTGSNAVYCVTATNTVTLSTLLSGQSIGGQWILNSNSPNNPGSAFNAGAGTLNLALINTVGNYIFDYIVNVQGDSNFDVNNCPACRSLASITISIVAACSAGSNNTITVTNTTGEFSLFNSLLGIPDTGGTWEQITGSLVTITGGTLGNVNLNSAQGCRWTFRYTCPGPTGCTSTAIITVVKNPGLTVNVIQTGSNLVGTVNNCNGTLTLQWQRLVSGNWTNISGATSLTYSGGEAGEIYRLIAICDGCQVASNQISFTQDCSCNNEGVQFSFNQSTDCLTITPNGSSCSEIASDVLEYRIPSGTGSYLTYSSPLCGCTIRDILDVTPSCASSSTSITIGYSAVNRCAGSIDRVWILYGNDTLETNVGSDITVFSRSINKSTFINTYNRSAKMIVRLNLGGGNFLIQEVLFTYNGSTASGDGCNLVVTTKLNVPKLYKSVQARRTVTYADNCPQQQFSATWTSSSGCENLYVLLNLGNQGGQPVVSGEVFNCVSPTRQWYRNGVLLPGETGFFLEYLPYGEGLFTMVATCGSCQGQASIAVQTCNVGLSITDNGNGSYTANAINCSGNKTYFWERFIGGTWTTITSVTTTSNSNTYTPTVGGTWRVRMICLANECVASQTFNVVIPCTVSVSLNQSGSNLVATTSNCAGTKVYQLFIWNAGTNSYNLVTTNTTTNNSVTFTNLVSGLYQVIVTCQSNECIANDTESFSAPCNQTATVNETATPGTFIGSVTGCTGNRNWLWQHFNGTTWVNVQNVTNSNPTNTFVSLEPGQHRLIVTCVGTNCQNTIPFNVNDPGDCDIEVIINSSNLPELTGIGIGCNGPTVWNWFRRATPGSGSWGSVISTSPTINVNSFGEGEYRVIITCGNCSGEATFVFNPCQLSVTINCNNNNPFTAVGTGCSGSGSYIWQYSPSGTGWAQVGTGATHTPTSGNGFYRVIFSCPGCNSVSAQCQFTAACNVNANLTTVNDKCDWSCPIPIDDNVSSPILVVINGLNAINGNYNLQSSAGRTSFKNDLETWLNNNNYGGIVSFTLDIYGKFGICVHISCTKANATRIDYTDANGLSTSYFGNCGKSCTYTYNFSNTGCDTITGFKYGCTVLAPWARNLITQAAQIKTDLENALTGAGYTGTVTVNTSLRRITIVTNAPLGSMLQESGSGCSLLTIVNATQSSCGTPTRVFPTINLSLTNCAGSQAITWQYRVNSSAPWTLAQTGGTSFQTCVPGQYRATGFCGDCPFTSNIITV